MDSMWVMELNVGESAQKDVPVHQAPPKKIWYIALYYPFTIVAVLVFCVHPETRGHKSEFGMNSRHQQV